MIEKKITITHKEGLRSRPAAVFVKVAGKFSSSIWLEKGSKKVNAKSIMGVMSLGVAPNTDITVICSGSDENVAMATVENMIKNDFEI